MQPVAVVAPPDPDAPRNAVVPPPGGEVRIVIPVAMASVASYLLILWVWGHAPIAPAAALRDTSAVFALLIAVIWLTHPECFIPN